MTVNDKTFEYMDEEWNPRVVKGIPKVILVRQVSAMQLKKLCRKGCQLYAAHILEQTEDETPRLEDFHVMQESKDVISDEISVLPPNRDIDLPLNLFQEQHQCLRHPTE